MRLWDPHELGSPLEEWIVTWYTQILRFGTLEATKSVSKLLNWTVLHSRYLKPMRILSGTLPVEEQLLHSVVRDYPCCPILTFFVFCSFDYLMYFLYEAWLWLKVGTNSETGTYIMLFTTKLSSKFRFNFTASSLMELCDGLLYDDRSSYRPLVTADIRRLPANNWPRFYGMQNVLWLSQHTL